MGRVRLRWGRWGLVGALLIGCGQPAEDPRVEPLAEPAREPAEAPPEPTEEPTPEPTEAAPSEPASPETAAAPTIEPASPATAFGRRVPLDDRTESRVRSAIRRRVGARPTLVTSLHYRRDDGGSVTVSTFTASYVERCVAAGAPREECTMQNGYQSLATDRGPCVFGGIARVDIGPAHGQRDGAMSIVAVRPIGDQQICVFEVEGLALADDDADGADEVVLSYAWADLRYRESGLERSYEGSRRVTYRADLEPQVELDVRAYHTPDDFDSGDRNMVSQLRKVVRQGHPDLALDVIDWLSDPCPDRAPPRGQEGCDIEERTVVYPYDAATDAWSSPPDDEDEPPSDAL